MPDRAWVALGDRAIRFARPVEGSARALVHAISAWPGVIDVVVAREDVAAYFDDAPPADAVLAARLAQLATLPADTAPARTHTLRAIYDGPDLAEVARASGLAIAEVVQLHAARTYVVATMGFAPGFAYLEGLDPRLATLERRATPRPRIAAGSLAIAGGYTAVYPFDSPGGWNLIGRVVDVALFDADGALFHLGDLVRFAPEAP